VSCSGRQNDSSSGSRGCWPTSSAFYSEADQVPYFAILGGVAIVIGVVLAVMSPWLKRLMGGMW